MASAALVYGMPVDTISLCAAASSWPHYQHAAIALGIAHKRKVDGTLVYASAEASKHVQRVGLGHLPPEVAERCLDHLMSELMSSVEHGKPGFYRRLRCHHARQQAEEMYYQAEISDDEGEDAEYEISRLAYELEGEMYCECRYEVGDNLANDEQVLQRIKTFLSSQGFALANDLRWNGDKEDLEPSYIIVPMSIQDGKDRNCKESPLCFMDDSCGCYSGEGSDYGFSAITMSNADIEFIIKSTAKQRLLQLADRFHLGVAYSSAHFTASLEKQPGPTAKPAAHNYLKRVEPSFMTIFRSVCKHY